MILFIYSLFLMFIVYKINQYISSKTKNLNQDELPKFLLTIILYNKLLLSMQIAAFFMFVSSINPINLYIFLPHYKIIFYHIITFLTLFLRDIKLESLGHLSNHTNLINVLMFLDTLKVIT